MIRRPPRSTRTDTLFPYTTLFRSVVAKPPRGETLHPGALRRPRSAARRAGKRQAQRILVVILDIIGPGDLLRPFGARRGAELVDGRIEQHFGARRIVILRSEARRVGTQGVRTCKSRWGPVH